MKAGLLDTRVVIQSRTLSKDDLGGPVETWSTFATIWAEVQEQRGTEVAAGRLLQTQGVRATIIRARWLAGVNATMRVQFRGRTAQIVSPPVMIGRKVGIELIVEDING